MTAEATLDAAALAFGGRKVELSAVGEDPCLMLFVKRGAYEQTVDVGQLDASTLGVALALLVEAYDREAPKD